MGYDLELGAHRLYKVVRVAAAQMLQQPASDHGELDVARFFERAVKVWHEEKAQHVAVRLSTAVARYAHEYPLVETQSVEHLDDGSVLIRAEVAGIVEAMRWVLSWGKDAEAIAPQALREAVHREVEQAADWYASGESRRGPRKASGTPPGVPERGPQTGWPQKHKSAVEDRDVAPKVRRGRRKMG